MGNNSVSSSQTTYIPSQENILRSGDTSANNDRANSPRLETGSVPTEFTAMRHRVQFCERKMDQIRKTPPGTTPAQDLLELASQLKYLSYERSETRNIAYGAHGVVSAITRLPALYVANHMKATKTDERSIAYDVAQLQKKLASTTDAKIKQETTEKLVSRQKDLKRASQHNREVDENVGRAMRMISPSRRDLAAIHGSDQKKVFDCLLSHLSPRVNTAPARPRQSPLQKMFGRTTSTSSGATGGTAAIQREVSESEIARRKALMPVWKEALQHTVTLKPERVKKLLDNFMNCFDDLPFAEKNAMVALYSPCFAHFAKTLTRITAPFTVFGHANSTSEYQWNALTFLRIAGELMTDAGQRTALAGELDKLCQSERERESTVNPIVHELESFSAALKRPSAH